MSHSIGMEIKMISETLYPRTKQELIRALQGLRISQIEIIEPYDPSNPDELIKNAKQMFHKSGNVTAILVRSQ